MSTKKYAHVSFDAIVKHHATPCVNMAIYTILGDIFYIGYTDISTNPKFMRM